MNNRTPGTEQTPTRPANKGQLFIYSIIFITGFLAGVAFTVFKGTTIGPQQMAAAPAGQETSQTAETRQALLNLEAEVTANPANFEAWTRLGHLYYDTEQPAKAIAAYSKALELHKGDANLLTDLGVMYRKTNQFQKAIESFDRAIKEDPSHIPSRYNKGIVMMYDLSDVNGAIASWEGLLRIDPQAKTASGESIRDLVDKMKAGQNPAK
jgi:cytochrome c-type biogenesis protein CcmH/NrfG